MSLFQRLLRQNAKISFYKSNSKLLLWNTLCTSPRIERNCVRSTWPVIFRWYLSRKEMIHIHPMYFLAIRNYGMKIPKKEKGKNAKVEIVPEEMEEIFSVDELNEKMNRIVENLKADCIKQLSIRTSPGAIETLNVKFEDKNYPLNEIAQVSRKNPQSLVINSTAMPQAVQPILKALEESAMNLNPQQEGNTIFITIPMITQEHRKQLSQGTKSLFLKSKSSIRDVQEHFMKKTRLRKDLSQDLIFRIQKQVKTVADNYISQAEMLMTAKQQELQEPKKKK